MHSQTSKFKFKLFGNLNHVLNFCSEPQIFSEKYCHTKQLLSCVSIHVMNPKPLGSGFFLLSGTSHCPWRFVDQFNIHSQILHYTKSDWFCNWPKSPTHTSIYRFSIKIFLSIQLYSRRCSSDLAIFWRKLVEVAKAVCQLLSCCQSPCLTRSLKNGFCMPSRIIIVHPAFFDFETTIIMP